MRYISGIGAALLAGSCLAQGIGGALLRQQQVLEERPAVPARPEDLAPDAAGKHRTRSGKIVPVKTYRLSTTLNIVTDEEINELLKAFRDRDVTFDEIQQAAELVGKNLRDQGYLLTRAYIPTQEIRDGVVTIAVIGGQLGRDAEGQPEIMMKVDSSLRLNLDFAKAVVDNAIPDDGPVKLEHIERGMLLLNELPGIQGAATIVPGNQPGTVGLALKLTEGPVIQGGLSVDNYGARTTGEVRTSASVAASDLSGKGDALELQVVSSTGTKILRSTYTVPLGASGLKSIIDGSFLTYKQGKELSVLDYRGLSSGLSLGLSYPIELTRSRSLLAMVHADAKRIVDSANGSDTGDKRTNSLTAGIQAKLLQQAWPAASSFGAYITAGELDKGRVEADLQQDRETQRADGAYTVLRMNAAHVQSLAPRFSVHVTFAGQTANKNLDSSEKFYLGGPRGVRAYPVEEAGGDDGGLLSIEGRWRPRWWQGDTDLAFITFIDAGRIRRNHTPWMGWNSGTPGMPNTYTLKGMGAGISLAARQWGKIDLLYARKIGSNPGQSFTGLDADGSRGKDRVWLTGALLFP